MPETGASKAGNRYELRIAMIGLIGALLGSFIGASSSYLTTRASLGEATRAQTRELETQREAAARTQRQEVYNRFLATANDYGVAAANAYKGIAEDCDSKKLCTGTEKLIGPLQASRGKFQEALNSVYIHGSDEAVASARQVAVELPRSLIDLTGSVTIQRIDVAAFTATYIAFQTVMCKELAILPRRNC